MPRRSAESTPIDDARQEPEHRGAEGDRQGDRDPVEDVLQHRLVGPEGVAEARRRALDLFGAGVVGVPGDDRLEEVPVLHRHRVVQVETLLDRYERGLVRCLAGETGGEVVCGDPGRLGDEEEDGEGHGARDEQQPHRAERAGE